MAKLYRNLMAAAATALFAFAANAQEANAVTFELSVTDVTVRDAYIKVTPSSSQQNYVWGVISKDKINRQGGIDNVYEGNDKAWWDFVADMNDDMTWQDAAKNDEYYGTVQGFISKMDGYDKLHWETDYYLYAYALDENYAPCTEVSYVELSTPAAEPSDLTFKITLNEVVADADRPGFNKASITVVPSNDEDSYGNHIHEARFYDFYVDNDQIRIR